MERIISKEHADSIFGMTKPEWEQNFKQFFAIGWAITTTPIDTGKSVTAYDPTTGFSLFIQPIFSGDQRPPSMVVVGSYYPKGLMPLVTASDVEREAQKDFGSEYEVRLLHKYAGELEVFQFLLRRAGV